MDGLDPQTHGLGAGRYGGLFHPAAFAFGHWNFADGSSRPGSRTAPGMDQPYPGRLSRLWLVEGRRRINRGGDGNLLDRLIVDLTRRGNPDYDRLLRKYEIKGVPTVVFLDRKGQERLDLRLVDYLPPDQFLIRMAEIRKGG